MDVFTMERAVPLFFVLFSLFNYIDCGLLCDSGFCRTYEHEVGCTSPTFECSVNNATHSGLWLPSPTMCNCCEYCLPLYGEDEYCSLGGPGMGTTVGRCGHGLTCEEGTNGHNSCKRMDTECHTAQDTFDRRVTQGQVGYLEHRPQCDGKGKYAAFDCVSTQTCFCQSEEGERIFGEVLYRGAFTERNMHCGCSRLHEKIKKNITPAVKYPVVGPRCTSDGNFNPIQCFNRDCYCVDKITGAIDHNEHINLDNLPLLNLTCYEPELDLFPQNTMGPPYNYTSPCLEEMSNLIEYIEQSEEDGFIMDYYTSIRPICLPDATYGRIATTRNGTKICVDERSQRIGDYEAHPGTPQFESMDCKCAVTTHIMSSMPERPVCCKNGNFRPVQCRRGLCHCVDGDGRQTVMENEDVTRLSCYTQNWRDC